MATLNPAAVSFPLSTFMPAFPCTLNSPRVRGTAVPITWVSNPRSPSDQGHLECRGLAQIPGTPTKPLMTLSPDSKQIHIHVATARHRCQAAVWCSPSRLPFERPFPYHPRITSPSTKRRSPKGGSLESSPWSRCSDSPSSNAWAMDREHTTDCSDAKPVRAPTLPEHISRRGHVGRSRTGWKETAPADGDLEYRRPATTRGGTGSARRARGSLFLSRVLAAWNQHGPLAVHPAHTHETPERPVG